MAAVCSSDTASSTVARIIRSSSHLVWTCCHSGLSFSWSRSSRTVSPRLGTCRSTLVATRCRTRMKSAMHAALDSRVIHRLPRFVFVIDCQPHDAAVAGPGRRQHVAQLPQPVTHHAVVADGEGGQFLDVLRLPEQGVVGQADLPVMGSDVVGCDGVGREIVAQRDAE